MFRRAMGVAVGCLAVLFVACGGPAEPPDDLAVTDDLDELSEPAASSHELNGDPDGECQNIRAPNAAPLGPRVTWIDVDLSFHGMWAHLTDGTERFFRISSGKGWSGGAYFRTPAMDVNVLERWEEKCMRGSAGGETWKVEVPSALKITDYGIYIHSAWWKKDIGETDTSHGCINMRPADARWVFLRTPRGTFVSVRNPIRP